MALPRAITAASRYLPVVLPALLLASCGGSAGGDANADSGILAIQGATIFTSPGVVPLEDATILIVDGIIEGVGLRGEIPIPSRAMVLDGTNLSVLPAFWNSHVRFDDELLALAETGTAAELEAMIWERFTRFGYSTIVETSRSRDELAHIVSRIDSGEVMGPRILAAGGMDVPRVSFPDPTSFPWAEEFLAGLAGGDVALVTAIELQRQAAIVLLEGDLDAVTTGVEDALARLRPFEEMGGRLLFGTGSGYINQYDPMSEHLLLEEAGLSFAARLSALTMEPAIRFGFDYLGAVEPGMVADLVIVDGDPEADITSLGRVRMVLREGRTIYW